MKDLLIKIKTLADKGLGGEKSNAEQLLSKLLKKHGITMAELDETKESNYSIKYKGKHEKEIVTQCALKVYGKELQGCFHKGKMYISCTALQYIEIEAMCEFYIKAFKKDLDIFVSAFIFKNDLAIVGEKQPTEEQIDRYLKATKMGRSMDKHNYLKQIEGEK